MKAFSPGVASTVDNCRPSRVSGARSCAGISASVAEYPWPPVRRRAARATFYAGLVADNLCGQPGRAEAFFSHALSACRLGADDDIAAEEAAAIGSRT